MLSLKSSKSPRERELKASFSESEFKPEPKSKSNLGFTIIEVVLVLAIAGLIFLIVFLALPGLQRSRRDAQRKSDLQKFVADMQAYESNNGGVLPNSLSCARDNMVIPAKSDTTPEPTVAGVDQNMLDFFWKYYKNDQNGDPSTGNYVNFHCSGTPNQSVGVITYMKQYGKCLNNRASYQPASFAQTDSAVAMSTESGYICLNIRQVD